ncbi:MAG: CAP domain-containing protein, partial [Planctomycetota bacterium]
NAKAYADIADGASRQVRETLEEEKAVFRAINDYRAMLGLTCLRFYRNLWRAAAAHAERCKGGRVAHIIGESTPLTRAREVGFLGPVGENLYQMESTDCTPQQVLEAWQLSPGHHANLLGLVGDPDDPFVDGAVSRRGRVWCMMFGGNSR